MSSTASAEDNAEKDTESTNLQVEPVSHAVCNCDLHQSASSVSSLRGNPVNDRILKTLCLYVSFASTGMCLPLVGTTLVHMERLFDSDTATMSWTFTAMAVGYLCGVLVCGCLFDRFCHELQLTIANGVEAAAVIVAPFSTSLPAFAGVLFVAYGAMGFIDASGQSYCVGLWTGHRYKDPALQALHAVWSLGSAIGPLIIGQFLVDLPPRNSVDNDIVNGTSSSTDMTLKYNFSISSGLANNSSLNEVSHSKIAVVRYAYVTIGAIVLTSSILYTAAYWRDRRANRTTSASEAPAARKSTTYEDVAKEPGDVDRAKRHRQEKLVASVFFIQLFLLNHIYAYIELTPTYYFASFAIKFLHWPVENASLLMSVYFGAVCAGRFLGIPLSLVLRPRTMIIINLLLTTVASVLLLAVRNAPELLWVSAVLAGSGLSTTFATMILWTAEFVPVSGRVASIAMCGLALGAVLVPQFVGRLFDNPAVGGPMVAVYVLVTAAVLLIVLFSATSLFAVHCLHRANNQFTDLQERVINTPAYTKSRPTVTAVEAVISTD